MGALTSEMLAGGEIVREPAGPGKGYWAGAPGACYDAAEKAFYLTYRIRRPRGVEPDRGGEVRIARSEDGVGFEDVWSVTKDAFSSPSIERCCLRRGPEGGWRYFASYVDPADGRWCVAVLKAPSVDALDPSKAARVLSAAELGLEGVKDPWILELDGVYHMILSVAAATPKTSDESHATQDIYNTGECVSATGLATSFDLDEWKWEGVVFTPSGGGWDGYCRRINSVVRRGERYFAFYDGGASERENYEEKTGLAESGDLKSWKTLTPDGPALTSPHASGSLRYMDAVLVGDTAHLFYEFARGDGSHDLLTLRIDADNLPSV